MEEQVKLWGLDVDKIKDIEDIKLILKGMDLFMMEDAPHFEEVKHLFCDNRKPIYLPDAVEGNSGS